jgi:chromosome segregation ATPase
MPDVTRELMFEVLKSIQGRLTQVDGKLDEMKQEMQASRTAQNGIRQQIKRLQRKRSPLGTIC